MWLGSFFMNPDFLWIKAKVECLRYSNVKFIEKHLHEAEMQDEDGYPTEIALEIIERWHWDDLQGLFDFIEGIWWMPSFGWHKELNDEGATIYKLATGGWSGNESIMHSLEQNDMIWHLTWVQSRRGGGYIFEVKEIENVHKSN
jgi:hypothetical protein